MSASSVHKEPEVGSLKTDSKKPEPLSISNGPKLASPFPSPTDTKKPASLRRAPTTDENAGLDSYQKKEAGRILKDTENRPSSLKHGSPRGRSSLSSRPPNRSTDEQQPWPRHQRQSSIPGASPQSRAQSVQFQDTDTEAQSRPQSRPASLHGDEEEGPKGKQSLFGKLKSLAAAPAFTSHSRSPSSASADFRPVQPDAATPGSERGEFRFPEPLAEEGSEIDADAEESGGEQRERREKKKLSRRRKQQQEESHTAPTTPKTTRRPSFHFASSFAPFENYRTNLFPRRASTTDFTPQQREGVSEDEGRERLNRRTSRPWAANRGLSYTGRQPDGTQDEQRPSNLRRLTGFAGPGNEESLAASWRRHRNERGTSASAQRWKQIKAGLKLIGQRRKPDNTVDSKKSAELLAELASAVPAALILASAF